VRSPHQNIFFYYRGQTRGTTEAEGQRLREQQVEDNTTKALVNLLEWSDDALTASFIQRFVPDVAGDGGGPFRYFLQGGPALDASSKWLLAISQSTDLPPTVVKAAGGSRVDGGFSRASDLLVVFEVKLGLELDASQLARHREHWGIEPANTAAVTWASVYEWAAQELAAESNQPVTRFLLGQFLAYLELSRLSPFAGLEERDFAFFDHPSWEQQPEIKTQLAALWETVIEGLSAKEQAELGAIHVGQLGLWERAWAQTHHKADKINLTLEMSSEGLELDLVAWSADRAQRMLEWLRSHGTKALPGLDGYELVLFQRRAKNYEKRSSGAKPWWQREDSNEVGRIEAGSAGATLESLLAQIDAWERKWEKPAFHLRRFWPRKAVTETGVAIVPSIQLEVTRLMPLLEDLNSG
jgi:hypothetical protein